MTKALLYKLPSDILLPNSRGYELIEFRDGAFDSPEQFVERNEVTDYVIFESGDHNTRENINYSLRFRHSMYIDNGIPVFDLDVAKNIAKRILKDSLRNPKRVVFNENSVPDQLLMMQIALPVDQRHPEAQTAIDRIEQESNTYFGTLDSITNASTIEELMDIVYPVGTSPDFTTD